MMIASVSTRTGVTRQPLLLASNSRALSQSSRPSALNLMSNLPQFNKSFESVGGVLALVAARLKLKWIMWHFDRQFDYREFQQGSVKVTSSYTSCVSRYTRTPFQKTFLPFSDRFSI